MTGLESLAYAAIVVAATIAALAIITLAGKDRRR